MCVQSIISFYTEQLLEQEAPYVCNGIAWEHSSAKLNIVFEQPLPPNDDHQLKFANSPNPPRFPINISCTSTFHHYYFANRNVPSSNIFTVRLTCEITPSQKKKD